MYGKLEADMENPLNCVPPWMSASKGCNGTYPATTDLFEKLHAGLVFNPIVTVTFQFIVDVGRSLGLWLGLSMLNFYDLIAMAFEFVTNKIICGKFKSVTSK